MIKTEYDDDYLAHYGVLGMKWGVRKDGKPQGFQYGKKGKANVRNENYTDKQRKRDQQIYGNRGVKRINRSMNEGNTISYARGLEVTRRNSAINQNKYARQAGKIGGAVAGFIAGSTGIHLIARITNTYAVRSVTTRLLGNEGEIILSKTLSNPAVQAIVGVGAAKTASMLAGDVAVDLNMRLRGYDPKRK